ncbi:MAG: preprotein translocase subunit SecE [Bacilli bacterium]|jgi:preprotein translocase SecE subunit|nr:preprotein translocase subunit SecE [Bacilli bacterium]MDD3388951.1 preprotein translocase subunit SecE [Bacilli bacterium]MDD4344390.1 preprotein translocase subunit SecE [Bacilli bacterium]MDD4520706.1 preprotein translocase subunit SecE [Bacilli bacterium]MDY0399319.1 preprotein translocase subunit SecE [Bacilli bacterium]
MGLRKYTKEVIKEGKRVRWPKRQDFLMAVTTVLAITIIAALILTIENLAAGRLLGTVEEAFQIFK